jgi:hypothetical protein
MTCFETSQNHDEQQHIAVAEALTGFASRYRFWDVILSTIIKPVNIKQCLTSNILINMINSSAMEHQND